MKIRSTRLKKIQHYIRTMKIQNQDELLTLLQKDGYDVTQATLSRDLKLLRVTKVSNGDSEYVYSLPGYEDNKESEEIYIQDILRGYISIDYSGNIVVIKTFGGHANAVSNALDALDFDEILGTVAGDNCIFACLREGVTGPQFLSILKERIPELEF